MIQCFKGYLFPGYQLSVRGAYWELLLDTSEEHQVGECYIYTFYSAALECRVTQMPKMKSVVHTGDIVAESFGACYIFIPFALHWKMNVPE